MNEPRSGEREAFSQNWKNRQERFYNHWTKGDPINQIQLAFRNHWEVFVSLMEDSRFRKGRRCLEVGCGRGTISAYFSDAGFDCSLIDISEQAISVAKEIFHQNNLKAQFFVGDANQLPFSDKSFDVVVSIGLLEHFEEIEKPMKEQVRILDHGGLFLGYIVPDYSRQDNVQKEYEWVNKILKTYVIEQKMPDKQDIFRSAKTGREYANILRACGLKAVYSSGIYPLPMISHSIEFPFSLMNDESERILVEHFRKILERRKQVNKKHSWMCREGYGQSILVWGYK